MSASPVQIERPCAICLEELSPERIFFPKMTDAICCKCCATPCTAANRLHHMECGHVFHRDCIEGWMEKSVMGEGFHCPLCRKRCAVFPHIWIKDKTFLMMAYILSLLRIASYVALGALMTYMTLLTIISLIIMGLQSSRQINPILYAPRDPNLRRIPRSVVVDDLLGVD
jgi:hypothetical protein